MISFWVMLVYSWS